MASTISIIIVTAAASPVFPNQGSPGETHHRQFRGTLFGSLLNLRLFDRRASAPDRRQSPRLALPAAR